MQQSPSLSTNLDFTPKLENVNLNNFQLGRKTQSTWTANEGNITYF